MCSSHLGLLQFFLAKILVQYNFHFRKKAVVWLNFIVLMFNNQPAILIAFDVLTLPLLVYLSLHNRDSIAFHIQIRIGCQL